MNRPLFATFIACLCTLSPSFAAVSNPSTGKSSLTVNNRVLAKVNGKAITLVDVVKKMDMLLYRHQPELLQLPEMRTQFYLTNWKPVLSDMIDRDLIMQEAEELKLPMSAGDVRQELEEVFGPQVMINLENAGLTFDEVWEMVRSDIIIRRMLTLRVNMPIMAKITPDEIRKSYDDYLKDASQRRQYTYRMISFKSEDAKKAEQVAAKTQPLLQSGELSLGGLEDQLKAKGLLLEGVTLSVSPVFMQGQEEILESIQNILKVLPQGSYSEPTLQQSRSEKAPLVRIYFLQEKATAQPASFDELQLELKESIARERQERDTHLYFQKLRKHFDVQLEDIQKDLPPNFAPFTAN